jgi:serine/threonine protein kinase/lipoprotein NlpI
MMESREPKSTTASHSLLADVVDEITQQLNAGECVSIDEYLTRYPEIADPLARVFETLTLVRQPVVDSKAIDSSIDSPLQGKLGDFRILREIGRGGMGVVYEAEQISLSRRMALKVLPFASVLDDRHLQRFKREAQAAAHLKHPNIVGVHSVGCERGVHFYAMEYIEGQTLEQVIRELKASVQSGELDGPVDSAMSRELKAEAIGQSTNPSGGGGPSADSPDQPTVTSPADTRPETHAAISTVDSIHSRKFFHTVAQLGIQAARALDYAHEMGIVHRDIKPSNLIVDAQGKLSITDFGLAMTQTDADLTMTGDVVGTLRYMSPEQLSGQHVILDYRTDVYSLGATLYELLTLRPAFDGNNRHDLMQQVAEEEPPGPCQVNRSIPKELETIALKAMAKEPQDRYASCGNLVDDLERFVQDRPILAKPPTYLQRAGKWLRRHRPLAWTAGVAVVLFLCAGVVGLSISNALISRERNEKDNALVALEAALESSDTNLQKSQKQQKRTEENLELALRAIDQLSIKAIGEDRLLFQQEGETTPKSSTYEPLTEQELLLLARGLEFYEQFVHLNNTHPEARFQVAQAYMRVGQIRGGLGEHDARTDAYENALKHLLKLTDEFPDHAEYLESLGDAYAWLGHSHRGSPNCGKLYESAVETYGRAIKNNPNSAIAYGGRGRVYEEMGFKEQPIADFMRACELDPNNALFHYKIALHKQFLEKPLALQHAREAVRLDKSQPWYHSVLAGLLSSSGDFSQALKHAETCRKLAPTGIVGYLAISEVYHRNGNLEQAIKVLDEGIQLIDGTRGIADTRVDAYLLYHSQGILFQKLGKLDRALTAFNKSIELNSCAEYTYDMRAQLLFQMGKYDQVLCDLEKAMEVIPGSSLVLYWIPPRAAAACPDEKFRQGLLKLADKRVENSNRSVRFLCARMTLNATFGRFDEAHADFTECIERKPKSGRYYHLFAWYLMQCPMAGPHEKSKTIELAENAVRLEPDKQFCRTSLSLALYRGGKFQEAIQTLDKSKEIFGNDDNSFDGFIRAMAHWQMGNQKESRCWYNRAVEWMNNSPYYGDIRHFHIEAAKLLGIALNMPYETHRPEDSDQQNDPPSH